MHHRVLERRRELLSYIRREAEAENKMTTVEMSLKAPGYNGNHAMLMRDLKALKSAAKLEGNWEPAEA